MPVWKYECPVNPKHKTYGTNKRMPGYNIVRCVDCGQLYTIKSKDTDYEVEE